MLIGLNSYSVLFFQSLKLSVTLPVFSLDSQVLVQGLFKLSLHFGDFVLKVFNLLLVLCIDLPQFFNLLFVFKVIFFSQDSLNIKSVDFSS